MTVGELKKLLENADDSASIEEFGIEVKKPKKKSLIREILEYDGKVEEGIDWSDSFNTSSTFGC